MRSGAILCIVSLCFCTGICFAEWGDAEVWYKVDDLGAERWQYTYELANHNLPEPVKEVTIWFDYGLYANLSINTPNPPAGSWSEMVVQPEPVFKDDGFYDTLALGSGISAGQSAGLFSVTFDWRGTGTPGPQFYEIVNPVTYQTIASGYTAPEPGTVVLLGLGAFWARRNLKSRRP
jgi:hypothetical protein